MKDMIDGLLLIMGIAFAANEGAWYINVVGIVMICILAFRVRRSA